ncbi:MAG: tetratricopeptide repeat protein [bacterium]
MKIIKHVVCCITMALAASLTGYAQISTDPLEVALKASYASEAKSDYQAAIKALTALGSSASSSYIAQLRLGWLNYCATEYQQSATYYKKAVQLAPLAIEPLLGQMLAQQLAANTDEAMRTGNAILRRDPNNYTATSRLAWLFCVKRDYKQAAILYRKLVGLYPTDTEMLLGLGYALKYSGEKKDADKQFNMVLLLSPDNARALEGLKDVPIGPHAGGQGNGMRHGAK